MSGYIFNTYSSRAIYISGNFLAPGISRHFKTSHSKSISMSTVPISPSSDEKSDPHPGPVGDGYGALDRNTDTSSGEVPSSVLKCQDTPGARKIPDISIALDEYALKTYPDVQKVALSVEIEHIRGQLSHFFVVPPDVSLAVSRSRISVSSGPVRTLRLV